MGSHKVPTGTSDRFTAPLLPAKSPAQAASISSCVLVLRLSSPKRAAAPKIAKAWACCQPVTVSRVPVSESGPRP
eukprot:3931969-Rhodomonas_salina.1